MAYPADEADHENLFEDSRDPWLEETEALLIRFDKVTKRSMFFHLFFTLLLSALSLGTLFFFVRLWEAWILAAGLGCFLLLLFVYFTMRLYMRLKRPLLYKNIQQHYVYLCHELVDADPLEAEHLLQVAQLCLQCAEQLEGREYSYYRLPRFCARLSPYQEMWSLWWHLQDVAFMRELLMLAAIELHLEWVRKEPTCIEAHTALANQYIALSSLYSSTLQQHEGTLLSSLLREEYSQKFRSAVTQAMQEFHVLCHYAPDDPWVHMQLACCYKDLQNPKAEMQEHIKVLKFIPDDQNTLLRLATLCFTQGQTAQGLQFYEHLCALHDPRAQSLLGLYGSCTTEAFY